MVKQPANKIANDVDSQGPARTEVSKNPNHIGYAGKHHPSIGHSVCKIDMLAVDRKINITVLEDPDAVVNLMKEHVPGEVISVNNNTISIRVNAEPKELADINAYLVGEGIKVVGFYEEKANLEDLFMQISSGKANTNEGTQCWIIR